MFALDIYLGGSQSEGDEGRREVGEKATASSGRIRPVRTRVDHLEVQGAQRLKLREERPLLPGVVVNAQNERYMNEG